MPKKLFIYTLILLLSCCRYSAAQESYINTSHLDHLYEEIVTGKDTMAIIHIYAEYPEYKWYDDSDEGTACVDDVARALIFYLDHYKQAGNKESLKKAKRLLNYIFYMQSDSGWFYNFTWKDNTINKEFRTSVAEPNWWSWRALWALTEANTLFRNEDKELSSGIKSSISRLLEVMLPWLDREENTDEFSGFVLPVWLPYETAADQAAIILKSLAIYYNDEKDEKLVRYIDKLAQGIVRMQAGDQNTFPHFAFLSWQNTWHAWGNSQAEALLEAGKVLNDTSYINAALNEIRHFYDYLHKEKYLSSFAVEKQGDKIEVTEQNKYSQIAYGIAPMVFASISAYEHTGDEYYADMAGKLSLWFWEDNTNSAVMYDVNSGRCYDGIPDREKINKNSGAESTIECLFTILAVEKHASAKKVIDDYLAMKKN